MKTKTYTKTKGFGSATRAAVRKLREETAKTVAKHGRQITAVVPDEGGTDTVFSYTIGNSFANPNNRVPELLLIYPSNRTASFLHNQVSKALLSGEIAPFQDGEVREVLGFLGANGEIPFKARLLTETERLDANESHTCQLAPEVPVLLLEIPDPYGKWGYEEGCHPEIRDSYRSAKFKV